MAETPQPTARPVYRNIHVSQIASYRLPPAGIVSILHRISGLVMFLLLPFVVWLLDHSLSSEISYDRFTAAYAAGVGPFPAWFVKLVTVGLVWAFLHHLIAGLRHLWMDATHSVTKEFGQSSALLTLGLSVLLTLLAAAKIFGLY